MGGSDWQSHRTSSARQWYSGMWARLWLLQAKKNEHIEMEGSSFPPWNKWVPYRHCRVERNFYYNLHLTSLVISGRKGEWGRERKKEKLLPSSLIKGSMKSVRDHSCSDVDNSCQLIANLSSVLKDQVLLFDIWIGLAKHFRTHLCRHSVVKSWINQKG